MTAPLRRVLVRPPQPGDAARWHEYGWRAEPDHARAAAEHEALRVLLEEAGGAEVVVAEGEPANPDAVYAYDPLLVGEEGAVLLRPGKDGRLGEPDALVPALERAGVPVAARVEAPGRVEGGDTVWLDERTLTPPASAAAVSVHPCTSTRSTSRRRPLQLSAALA